ncbi:hypothetical protein Tco_0410327 [Tanacetum coccineum]
MNISSTVFVSRIRDKIVDGDLQEEATPAGEQSSPPTPKTAKQLTAKRNQERVKSILLLAIPDEYLLKFHNVPDAKSLWAANKSRVYEDERKRSLSSTSNSQNLAFLFSENTSSTNEVSTASGNFLEYKPAKRNLIHQVMFHYSRWNQGKRSYSDNGRRNATTNEPSSQALVAQDGLGGYD